MQQPANPQGNAKMTTMTTILKSPPRRATLAACTLAAAVPALAAPPDNWAGTTWTMQVNRSSEQLVITHQGGPGAPGARACRLLIGTLGVAPVRGWYCPNSGRVHPLHQNLGRGETVRVFTGQVSDDIVGQPLYIGGTVAIDNAAFGDMGESNFSAIR